MGMKEVYEQKLNSQLVKWTAEIDEMKAEAEKKQADVQLKYYETIEDLESKRRAAQEKLKKLSESSDSAWEDLKAGSEAAWTALGESLESAKSRFR